MFRLLMVFVLLLATQPAAAMKPIQGGRFDWQCKMPTKWHGSDYTGDYQVCLIEMTFILQDENGREVMRRLELQTYNLYTRVNHPELSIYVPGLWVPSICHCPEFKREADRLERRAKSRTNDQVCQQTSSPCDTVNIVKIFIGIPQV